MIMTTFAAGVTALAITLPLAWKWELGVRRVALGVACIALASGLLISAIATAVELSDALRAVGVAVVTLATAFGILTYRFYRDPERTPPADDRDIVVSPADGEVVYVRRSQGGVLPSSTKKGRDYELVELTKTALREDDAIVIGIAMSFLDVHVNRAPIAGRVRLRKHFPGRFGSLGNPEMIYENERATTVIERGDLEVAVIQIASRLVRQIASYVAVGDEVGPGQRIGVIRLGSQVDVVLPARPNVRVRVSAGQRVRAGESVLAVLETVSVAEPVADVAATDS